MLPLGFVALFAAALLFRKRMALLAFASMMLIVTPWIVVLSVHDGRPTIGAAGSLNYSWLVSGFRLFTHAREGTHPTRQIGENPEVFEFAQPIPGSYPPWRDPAYWNGGLPVRFSLSHQIAVFAENLRYTLILMAMCPGLLAALLLLPLSATRKAAARMWPLAALAGAALLMYAAVLTQGRYAAPFLLVGSVFALALSGSRWVQRTAIITCLYFVIRYEFNDGYLVSDEIRHGLWRNPHVRNASELRELGLRPNDKVGIVGYSINCYWAAVIPVQIVTEVPVRFVLRSKDREVIEDFSQIDTFWKNPRPTIEIMRRVGIRAIVADAAPIWADTSGWIRLKSFHWAPNRNGMYLLLLDESASLTFAPIVR